MKQISDLLNEKGRDVWSLPPDATVYDAIDQMAEKGVGALLVMGASGSSVSSPSATTLAR